jgi:hypothetical protein
LPPSSSSTGFRCSAQSLAIVFPTFDEPVKLTRFTAGWAISDATTLAASDGALEIRLTTTFGKPAWFMVSTMRWCVAGQTSEERRITVLPQASGAAIALTPRISGAFHGAIPSTTPAGWRTASDTTLGLSAGMISPVICVVSAAASRRRLAAKWTLKAGPGPRRADLLGHRLGEVVRPRLENVGSLHEQRAPLARTRLRPGGKRPRGRLDHLGDVGFPRRRRLAPVTGS